MRETSKGRWATVALAVLTAWGGAALAEAPAPPATVSETYNLDVTLDPTRHVVRGRVRIAFTNASTRALHELVFHLYLNAFRDPQSVFMRESDGRMRNKRFSGRGSIELESLRVEGKEQLENARRELLPGDFTQLALPLTKAVAIGERVVIESTFTAHLPPVFARTGHSEDFYCVAQWFPKLAKLESDGHFESFPYHALGEFYAAFADYELTVRTPHDYVVGANGKLVREAKDQSQTTRTYAIARALDAVWVASRSLQVHKETWRDVAITYLYPPGYDLALDEHADTVRSGLSHFGQRFGEYPYPTLTVVIPPRRAAGAAGMEYPAFFLTDGSWLPAPGSPGVSGAFVTAHELAHQWFPMVIASNEVRYPVLDEGFAEWAALDLLRTRFGETGALSSWLPFSRFELERVGSLGFEHAIASGLSAPSYNAAEYAASVYGRAALVLETVRRTYGKERFDEALLQYARTNAFAHPTPSELGAAFDGVYGPGFSRRVLLPLLLEGKHATTRLVSARAEQQDHIHVTRARARRFGEVALPTWLAAYNPSGKELARLPFPDTEMVLDATFETSEPVSRVVLDPDRANLIDPNARDQTIQLDAPTRSDWISRALAGAQMLFAWLGP